MKKVNIMGCIAPYTIILGSLFLVIVRKLFNSTIFAHENQHILEPLRFQDWSNIQTK